MIKKIKPHQIFVFGSNENGEHIGGAARQAYESFGAVWCKAHGLQGQSYAIPTLDKNMQKMPLNRLANYFQTLKEFAEQNPEKEFLLTKVGQGIAGFSAEEMESVTPEMPSNVVRI